MADPTTGNILLAVPTRGGDPGTWDVPVNNNSSAIDGFFGGSTTISVSNANFSLTAPTGTVTPTSGPTQSQNRILKFTGTLTANVQVTLPLPGEYTVQNLSVGNFVLSFIAAGLGKVVATPQGSVMKIWNDGTDVWLVKPSIPGALTFLGGVSAAPSWITACTVKPFLLCDGSVYNFSDYTALGNLYLGNFGGNGVTTFGVQDLRGRVPLAYDGTGTRITAAGCGINGQALGAAGGHQLLQSHTHANTLSDPGHSHLTDRGTSVETSGAQIGTTFNTYVSPNNGNTSGSTTGITINNAAAGGGTSQNVQPSQVAGIWLVST